MLLPQPLGPEDADELALVRQVFDEEAHVADRRVLVGQARVVGLGDVAELDDTRQTVLLRLAETVDDLAHADRRGLAAGCEAAGTGMRRSVMGLPWRRGSDRWTLARLPAAKRRAGDLRRLQRAAPPRSSQARSTARRPPVQQAVAAVLVGEQLPLDPKQKRDRWPRRPAG